MRSGFDRPVAVNRQPKLEIFQRRCQPGRVPRRGVPLRELLPGNGTAQAAGRPIELLTPGVSRVYGAPIAVERLPNGYNVCVPTGLSSARET